MLDSKAFFTFVIVRGIVRDCKKSIKSIDIQQLEDVSVMVKQ